jgi:hypothetical protein
VAVAPVVLPPLLLKPDKPESPAMGRLKHLPEEQVIFMSSPPLFRMAWK